MKGSMSKGMKPPKAGHSPMHKEMHGKGGMMKKESPPKSASKSKSKGY